MTEGQEQTSKEREGDTHTLPPHVAVCTGACIFRVWRAVTSRIVRWIGLGILSLSRRPYKPPGWQIASRVLDSGRRAIQRQRPAEVAAQARSSAIKSQPSAIAGTTSRLKDHRNEARTMTRATSRSGAIVQASGPRCLRWSSWVLRPGTCSHPNKTRSRARSSSSTTRTSKRSTRAAGLPTDAST